MKSWAVNEQILATDINANFLEASQITKEQFYCGETIAANEALYLDTDNTNDSWTDGGSGSGITVQSGTVYSGTKAVKVTPITGSRLDYITIADAVAGNLVCYMYLTGTDNTGTTNIYLNHGATEIGTIGFYGTGVNTANIRLMNTVNLAVGITLNTWYKVEIEWDDAAQPDKMRGRVNDGSWSSWTATDAAYAHIDRICIYKNAQSGDTYIDDFSGSVFQDDFENSDYIDGNALAGMGHVYVYKTDADLNAEDTWNFIGFALEGGVRNAQIYVQMGGIVSGFTGLTKEEIYYLSGTAGGISTTPGSNSKRVGVAVSATKLFMRDYTFNKTAEG